MKKTAVTTVILSALMLAPVCASAQYKDNKAAEETPKTKTDLLLEGAKAEQPVVITLEQALEIALVCLGVHTIDAMGHKCIIHYII